MSHEPVVPGLENRQLTTRRAADDDNAERRKALNRIAREAFESGLYDRTAIPENGSDD